MQDSMPTVPEDRENHSQADFHSTSAANLSLSFNASTTSQTPLLDLAARNSDDQSHDRDQGRSQPNNSGHDLRRPNSDEDPVTARAGSLADPPQPILRSVSTSSSNIRSSIDTMRTLGSGSEESQRGLLGGLGWAVGAVYRDNHRDEQPGSAVEGSGQGREAVNGAGTGVSGERNEGLGETLLSAEELQARGAAPPYFEVVERQDRNQGSGAAGGMGVMEMTTMRRDGGQTGQGQGQARESRRRSGFRSFAARLSQLMPLGGSSTMTQSASVSAAPLPTTTPLLPSSASSSSPSPPSTSTSASMQHQHHSRHRSATSGSGSTTFSATSVVSSTPASPSTISLSRFPRTPSRLANLLPSSHSLHHQLRNQNGNSTTTHPNPSTSSLSSTLMISPPLSHTLVRTNFVYPSAGPTTEQMRFISSRESIVKFGVPYGPGRNASGGEGGVGRGGGGAGEEPPPFDWDAEGDADATTVQGESENSRASDADGAFEGASPPRERSGSRSESEGSVRSGMRRDGGAAGEENIKEGELDDVDLDVNVGTGTVMPAPTLTPPALVIDLNTDAARSVPTPPPTPPGDAGPGLASEGQTLIVVPRIEVAPASPASPA